MWERNDIYRYILEYGSEKGDEARGNHFEYGEKTTNTQVVGDHIR